MIEGWPSREAEINDPILKDCFRRGGFLFGAFDKETLKAVVVIDPKWLGKDMKTLELKFLHVDKNYRREGVGKSLFNKAVEKARALGANRLYISSSESKNTVEFYKSLDCELASEVDEELLALEPKDIHMELHLDRLVENGSSLAL